MKNKWLFLVARCATLFLLLTLSSSTGFISQTTDLDDSPCDISPNQAPHTDMSE